MDRVAPKNAANIWRLAARQKQRRQREVTTPFNWRLAFRAHIKVGRGRSPEADCVAACTPRPTNPPRSVLHGCSVVATLFTYAISPHELAPLRRHSTLAINCRSIDPGISTGNRCDTSGLRMPGWAKKPDQDYRCTAFVRLRLLLLAVVTHTRHIGARSGSHVA